MATITDFLNDLSTYQEMVRQIDKSAQNLHAISKTAEDKLAFLVTIRNQNRRFADVCAKLKWPPPWHLAGTTIDQIIESYEAGVLSANDLSDIFVAFYTEARVTELRQMWETYSWLSQRMPILREAMENHVHGRHFSAVCVLMPQIEGILRDVLGERPTPAKSASVISGSGMRDAARTFFADVIWENFNPDANAPIPDLSRHAILHGKSLDYGTPLHSLKVILLIDIILACINRSRSENKA